MAPFGLKLWGHAFQMIPDISFFDVEKKIRQNLSTNIFAGIFYVWLEDTCVLARRHMCPGKKTHVSWPEDTSVLARDRDTSVLARKHFCPGWKTHVFWLENISVLARRHMCSG